MTANIREVADGGEAPNTPTVAEMRASQAAGSVGKGTQTEDYGQMQAHFNVSVGKDTGPDKPSYPSQSNDEDVSE